MIFMILELSRSEVFTAKVMSGLARMNAVFGNTTVICWLNPHHFILFTIKILLCK